MLFSLLDDKRNPQSKSLRVIRFVDKSMKYTEGFNLTIQGDDCPGQFPVDGIAFHPQSNRVYYCPLSSTNLYSFDASTFFSSTSKLRASVRFEGTNSLRVERLGLGLGLGIGLGLGLGFEGTDSLRIERLGLEAGHSTVPYSASAVEHPQPPVSPRCCALLSYGMADVHVCVRKFDPNNIIE